jgi:hypothetical protein
MIFIKELIRTCSACPSQWEGRTTDGQEVCIRYRWGRLRVVVNDRTVFRKDIGDSLAGVIDLDEVFTHLPSNILIEGMFRENIK